MKTIDPTMTQQVAQAVRVHAVECNSRRISNRNDSHNLNFLKET